MSKYAEMLRDPRWQRRRLEILHRDDFTCQTCESKEKTLHVHHMYYEKGKMPWEYPEHALRTLCSDCHEDMGTIQQQIARTLSRLSVDELHAVHGFAKAAAAIDLELTDDWDVMPVYHDLIVHNAEELEGALKFFEVALPGHQEREFIDYSTGQMNVLALEKAREQVIRVRLATNAAVRP